MDTCNTPPSKKQRRGSSSAFPRPTRSCAECRRRRIRCDGVDSPCGQCSWYNVPALCVYPARKPRIAVSNKLFQEVSESLEKSTKVLQELFPSISLEFLAGLSRPELLRLVQSPGFADVRPPLEEAQNDDIQCLEPSPQQGFEWDESERNQEISDDVNGLSLVPHSSSSYLGISSINAVLRVIAFISPSFESQIQHRPVQEYTVDIDDMQSQPEELSLIDAFFDHIHSITPIVDEVDFRAKYLQKERNDSSWQALLNMVLAMGSISTSTPDERTHSIYYHRALEKIGLLSFGSGHLETVQALAILGGYYSHNVNQPNMAYVVMGAALRMAIAMGLHREPAPVEQEDPGSRTNTLCETRRRVWWSLFCLDTWSAMLLGRPSLGRWDPDTITVRLPSPSDPAGISLRSSVLFCKVGTSMQDRLAHTPLMSSEEIRQFEDSIHQWKTNVPVVMRHAPTCPVRLKLARVCLHIRHLNMRLVLNRPLLLTTSLRRARNGQIQPDEIEVVERCRSIALTTVAAIQEDWFPIQLCARSLNWFLFQACMVLLLSLFSEPNHPDVHQWTVSMEVSLDLFEKMSPWGLTIRRTREVIQLIYGASQATATQTQPDSFLEQDVRWEPSVFWDSANWDALLGFTEFDFEGTDFWSDVSGFA